MKFSPVNIKEREKLDIRPGDTIRVWQKIQEKEKTRLQAFEGLVISRKHGREAGATFTVRKIASGVGVEKNFPLYSPMIDKIEIVRRSRVRRAKLYYIRHKSAKSIRKKMKGLADFVPVAYQETSDSEVSDQQPPPKADQPEAETTDNQPQEEEKQETPMIEEVEEKKGEIKKKEEK